MESSISFKDLPIEMKTYIFSYFHPSELNRKVSKVCKEWRQICCDPFLWRNFVVGKTVPSSSIKVLLNRNEFVRHIEIHSRLKDIDWLNHVEKKHNSVRSIYISLCRLSKTILSRLTSVFPRVEKVVISFCHFVEDNAILEITKWNMLKSFEVKTDQLNLERRVCLIAEQIHNLEEVVLDGLVCDEDFQTLIEKHGKTLKSIKLFCSIFDDSFELLAVTCVRLKHLYLYGANFMSNRTFLILMKNLSTLEALSIESLSTCELFNSKHYSFYFQNPRFETFENVVKLNIMYCKEFNDTCLETIAKWFPLLKDIRLQSLIKVTNEGLKNIAKICCMLERLTIEYMNSITEECLREIANYSPHVRFCIAIKCELINDGNWWKIRNTS